MCYKRNIGQYRQTAVFPFEVSEIIMNYTGKNHIRGFVASYTKSSHYVKTNKTETLEI